MRRLLTLALLAAAALSACGGDDSDSGSGSSAEPAAVAPTTGRTDDEGTRAARLPTGTVVKNLDIPWELAFLPDGSALVTERPGRVVRLDKRLRPSSRPAANVEVDDSGEGGLLGLAVDPRFKRNKFVYLYRTTDSGNEVVRYRYKSGRLTTPDRHRPRHRGRCGARRRAPAFRTRRRALHHDR